MKMQWGKAAALFAASLTLAGLGSVASADDSAASVAGPVTYAKNVAPILNKNCVVCHRQGQIGPMSLMSYQEARPFAKAIKKSITERTMPPWFASPEHGKFSNDTRLSDADIAALSKWADTGAPMGDNADLPPVPQFADEEWLIGKPDAVFTMEPFKVTDDIEDHYEYVTIKNPLNEDKWIKAVEIKPGMRSALHHNLVFVGPEGMDPRQIEQALDLFAKWGPGNNPDFFPEGHGKLLPAHASIVFQLHYHKTPGPGTGGVDQTRMGVIFHDKPVEHPMTTAWILDPRLNIKPGEKNYEATSMFRFIDDGHIYSLAPHAHLRGKDFTYTAEYPDGTSEVLLHVPKYDFNWQINYLLAEPKAVPRGTKIRVVAHYDNSADNKANPNPNETVRWGESTTEEMMIGFMDYTYAKRKNFQRTLALPEGINDGSALAGGGFGGGRRHDREGRRGRSGDQQAPKSQSSGGGAQ